MREELLKVVDGEGRPVHHVVIDVNPGDIMVVSWGFFQMETSFEWQIFGQIKYSVMTYDTMT